MPKYEEHKGEQDFGDAVGAGFTGQFGTVLEAEATIGMDLGMMRIDVPASAAMAVAYDPYLQRHCDVAHDTWIDGVTKNGIFFTGEFRGSEITKTEYDGSEDTAMQPLFGCPSEDRAIGCPKADRGIVYTT